MELLRTIVRIVTVLVGVAPPGHGVLMRENRWLVTTAPNPHGPWIDPGGSTAVLDHDGVSQSISFGGYVIARRIFVGRRGHHVPVLFSARRRQVAYRVRQLGFPVARFLLRGHVEGSCEICGCPMTGQSWPGWHDEGAPMTACYACRPMGCVNEPADHYRGVEPVGFAEVDEAGLPIASDPELLEPADGEAL